MKRVQIVGAYGECFHAGPKAQRDVTEILSTMKWRNFEVVRPLATSKVNKIWAYFKWFFKCNRLRKKLPNNSTLVLQFPSAAYSKLEFLSVITGKLNQKKKNRLVVLIHDISSFREAQNIHHLASLNTYEKRLFEMADILVAHNNKMKELLVANGIKKEKIRALGVFDYLVPSPFSPQMREKSFDVVIAGNLDVNKTAYIGQLDTIEGINWMLYGINYSRTDHDRKSVCYQGAFSPERLPKELKGSFGLVWDGDSAQTCAGAYGEYTRINNPHKLSLYLASGLPVIVWEEAAVADVVRQYKCGFTIKSLDELYNKIDNLSHAQYSNMLQNAIAIGEKIREGFFLKQVLKDID